MNQVNLHHHDSLSMPPIRQSSPDSVFIRKTTVAPGGQGNVKEREEKPEAYTSYVIS